MPTPTTLPTAQGPVDLVEASNLALAFDVPLGHAVEALVARELEAWPPAGWNLIATGANQHQSEPSSQ